MAYPTLLQCLSTLIIALAIAALIYMFTRRYPLAQFELKCGSVESARSFLSGFFDDPSHDVAFFPNAVVCPLETQIGMGSYNAVLHLLFADIYLCRLLEKKLYSIDTQPVCFAIRRILHKMSHGTLFDPQADFYVILDDIERIKSVHRRLGDPMGILDGLLELMAAEDRELGPFLSRYTVSVFVIYQCTKCSEMYFSPESSIEYCMDFGKDTLQSMKLGVANYIARDQRCGACLEYIGKVDGGVSVHPSEILILSIGRFDREKNKIDSRRVKIDKVLDLGTGKMELYGMFVIMRVGTENVRVFTVVKTDGAWCSMDGNIATRVDKLAVYERSAVALMYRRVLNTTMEEASSKKML